MTDPLPDDQDWNSPIPGLTAEQQLEVDYTNAAVRLRRELEAAGIGDLDVLESFDGGPDEFDRAATVLLEWLPRVRPETRRLIVKVLSTRRPQRQAIPAILHQYRTMTDEEDPGGYFRFSFGDALGRFADDAIAHDLIELAQDRAYGWMRSAIVQSLWRLKKRRVEVIPILIDLLDDESVVCQAIESLRKFKATEALEALQVLVDHQDPDVRQEAKKAVARLTR